MPRVIARSLALVMCLGMLALPTPARASSVAVVSEELLIGTDPGEQNRIIVELVGKDFLVSDTAGMDPGAGCHDAGEHISCNGKNVVLVTVNAGDMDDVVRLSGVEAYIDAGPGNDRVVTAAQATVVGGPGNDRIKGGNGNDLFRGGADDDVLIGKGGKDVLKGGSGDDRIEAQDGEKDRVSGGSGNDQGDVDCDDRVSKIEEGSTACA
jgi:Ca2+-binding RTX toxin-like protein